MPEGFFFERHTIRSDKSKDPASERYPGITETGVELIEEKLPEIDEIVESSAPDTIIFLGGTSEEDRIKSTADVIGDRLAERYQDRDDILVLTHANLKDMIKTKQFTHILDGVTTAIANNPNKRIIISYPFFLKEFSLRPFFRDRKTGEHTEFSKELYAAGKGSEEAATDIFMSEKPLENIEEYPITPQELAERHIRGIERLRNFAHQYSNGREVMCGVFGHGWNLDALASYLANEGHANYAGFIETGGQEIQQAEIGLVDIKDEGTVFKYRGREFAVPPTVL